MKYIALDIHNRYSWAHIEDAQGRQVSKQRIEHARGARRTFLQGAPPHKL